MMPRTKNILLYPFSLAYGLLTAARNFLYDTGILRSERPAIPVICVGNITVGGTGKTPHTEYLARLLHEHFNVAVLSRGYRRKSTGFVIASTSSSVNDIGDEPLQISQKYPGIVIAVDADRIHGVNEILRLKPGTDVIILDDGFQHRSLNPGFTILLTDYNRLMTRDNLLPYGSLRESSRNMRRADVIIVTKTPAGLPPIDRRIIMKEFNIPEQNLYFTSLLYGNPRPVFGNPGETPDLTGSSVLLVTGIANPRPLSEYLNEKVQQIKSIEFPDHHRFIEKDIDTVINEFNLLRAELKYVITTEKDAVRLREFSNIADDLKSAFWYIPVETEFVNGQKDDFDNLILDYVRENKRNN